jgi:ATP-dependent protease HslVU (ClpYQ) ATPase subunit
LTDWRKRKHGTPRQIGQAFPVDEASTQKKKSALKKIVGNLNGSDRSMRTKKFVEGMKEILKSKDQKLMESEILTPNDVTLLCDRGLLEIDDDDEIKLTAKGIAFLQKQRQKEKPREYTKSGQVRLTEQNKKWLEEDEEKE